MHILEINSMESRMSLGTRLDDGRDHTNLTDSLGQQGR